MSGYLVQLADEGDAPRSAVKGVGPRRGRPARVGRGVRPRRRVDRPRRHQRAPVRRGAHAAGVHGEPRRSRRPSTARATWPADDFEFEMRVGRASATSRRPTTPYTEETWAGAARGGRRGRRAAARARRRAHHGRRAHVQRTRAPARQRVERRRARPDQVGGRGSRSPASCSSASRARRRDPAPDGQAVPGREPAALGARDRRAPRRRADLARPPRGSTSTRRRAGDPPPRRGRARRFAEALARASGSPTRGCSRPTKTRGTSSLDEQEPPRRRRPARRRPARPRGAAPPRARARARPRAPGRLRAAAHRATGDRLGHRAVELPARALFLSSRATARSACACRSTASTAAARDRRCATRPSARRARAAARSARP